MDVFDLQAKISLDTDGYEKELDSAKSKFSGFADGLKGAASKVGDVLVGIGKAATVGIGAASTALTALTKQSLDAVGSYEQLVGGVDTLFKDASQKVQDYANKAYMTAGMSANEYMETTIQFSASLIQGLEGDTQKAADIANTAIVDMSDNVNKMGTTMEAVQNAYRGLARQNFTMLDNLALGYQGTADEMARLINDTGVMGDAFEATAKNVKEIPFDKYIEAIHKVQVEMGISGMTQEEAAKAVAEGLMTEEEAYSKLGTTAKEASGTITGSAAAAKAAWQNFLTGTGSAEQFVTSMSMSITNIKKNLKNIIPRLTEGLTELVDLIAPEIPPLIEEMLPPIISGSSKLLENLAKRLPEIITTILPAVTEGVVDVSVAIVGALPKLVSSLKESIPIVVKTIMEKKDELITAGKDLIKALFPEKIDTKTITEISKTATEVVGKFAVAITDPKAIKKVVEIGDDVIGALIDGLLSEESIQAFITAAPDIIENLVKSIETILLGSEQDGEGGLFGAANKIVQKIGDYFADEKNRKDFLDAAVNIITALGSGLLNVLQNGVAPLMVEVARAWAQSFIGEIDYNDTAYTILKRLAEAFVHNLTHFGVLGQILERNSDREDYLELDPDIFGGTMSDYDRLSDEEQYQLKLQQIERDSAAYNNDYTTEPEYSKANEQLKSSNVPDFVKEQMRKGINAHAEGFDVKEPVVLGDHVVGEAGEEVLLPLDSNTGWMDKFAYRLDNLLNREESSDPMLGRMVTLTNSIDNKFDKIIDEKRNEYNNYPTEIAAAQPTWIPTESTPPVADDSWIDKFIEKASDKLRVNSGDIYITVNAQSDRSDDIVSALDEAFRDRQIAQDRSTGGTGWK